MVTFIKHRMDLKNFGIQELSENELQTIDGGIVFMTALLVAALIGTAGVTAGYFYHKQ